MALTIIFFTLFAVVKGQIIGDGCKYDDSCFVEHSYCEIQQVCECKENFLPSSDRQSCIAMVGAICTTRHDCASLIHSTCDKEGRCICEKGYVPNAHMMECLKVATYINESCIQDNQCQVALGDKSYCHRQQCQCLPNNHFDKICIQSKRLDEMCHNNTECYLGESFKNMVSCVRGKCQCSNGYVRIDNYCRDFGVRSAPMGAFIYLMIYLITNLA